MSNWSMLRVLGRSWPLVVSAGVHVALATALVASGARSQSIAPEPVPVRDIWIGDTLEVSESAVDADKAKAAADVEPAVAPVSAIEPRKSPAPPPPEPEAPAATIAARRPAEESLAQRILAYRPKSGHAESPETNDAAPSERSRVTAGGMPREDAAPGARGFAKAFARALPVANSSDPIWAELPLGRVGFVRVSVTVDADGAIGESKVLKKPETPPSHLARLVDRTLILLRGGRFALTNGSAGTETLRLDVTLSERPMESGPLALGFEAPSPGNPGRSYFQLASGRFVEAKLTIEPR